MRRLVSRVLSELFGKEFFRRRWALGNSRGQRFFVGAALAHDHVVRATKYSGQIQLDPATPTAAQITVEGDATALVADEPETRQKYNLPLGLSEENRREIQQTLESEGQLSVRRYPTIHFRSARIALKREGHTSSPETWSFGA
ncbi:MAG: hypothetical protein AB7P69_01095 [Candidatus Binatia bacterium]